MLKKILLSSSLFTVLAGCGGQPDTLWKVSAVLVEKPANCYVGGKLPLMMTTEVGLQVDVGPWEMYDGPDSKMYLMLGDKKSVIEGTKTESYNFPWTITETDIAQNPTVVTTTDTQANTITFKTSGDTLSGTWEVKETHTCAGIGCTMVQPNCTVVNQIKGRRLEAQRYRVY